jgi:hypothetical protein
MVDFKGRLSMTSPLRIMMLGTILLASLAFVNARADAQVRKMIGGDRDRHGCIGSAGYSWCRTTGQCERPWMLAKAQGFANELPAYKRFCNRPPKR